MIILHEKNKKHVNGTGMWFEGSNTSKYQYHYGSSDTLYYTKTLIKFKKTSSSPPVFIYFTVHYDNNGGDLNTYPAEFKNQIYILAYGVEGLTDHVDSEVYDAHEAFEIDKTKMKMLVPLDMNGQKIMNTNFDLKFGDLFKIIECKVRRSLQHQKKYLLHKKSENSIFSVSSPLLIHAINFLNYQPKRGAYYNIVGKGNDRNIKHSLFFKYNILFDIFKVGIAYISFTNIINHQFDVVIVVAYM